MIARKKTERRFTPIESISQFADKLGGFGDATAYRYFDRDRNLCSLSYAELSARIRRQAAGLASAGLAGKRIAVIGETSVEWVTSYTAIIASGGVSSIDDVKKLREMGLFGAIIGKAYYTGAIDLSEAISIGAGGEGAV